MASLTSGSASETVLPASRVITAMLRVRWVDMCSATFSRIAARSAALLEPQVDFSATETALSMSFLSTTEYEYHCSPSELGSVPIPVVDDSYSFPAIMTGISG